MKTVRLAISLFFLILYQSPAQVELGSEVWASSGNSYFSNDLIVDWTMGESVIFSGDISDGVVSQGFQQPMICKTIPVIVSQNETSCQNAYTLTVNFGFDYYQWRLEQGLIINHKTNLYLPVENGNYSVIVGDSSGCLVSSSPILVDLSSKNSVPVVSVFGTGIEDTLAEASEATSYQWYLITSASENPKAIVGATQKTYKPIISGTYFVKINSKTYCTAISSRHDLKTNNTMDFGRFATTDSTIDFSILTILDRKLTIYPNPAKGNFFIDYESPNKNAIWLELYSMLGVLIDSKELANNTGNFHKEIDEFHYAKGIYLIKIKDRGNTIFKSLILE